MNHSIHLRTTLPATLVLAAAGCLTDASTAERAEARIDITEDLFDDMKRVDTRDLIWGAGHLGTDELNARIASALPYADIRLATTELYGIVPPDEAGTRRDLTMHDIESLSSTLAERYGDRTLPAEINGMRRRQIEAGNAGVYAESAFRLGANFDPAHRAAVHGLGPDVRSTVELGITAGAGVETRVISAYPLPADWTTGQTEVDAIVASPLQALYEARGFIVPRSLEDVRDSMKPGECIGFAGDGKVGVNFGAGMPILLSNPIADFTYNIRIYGGVSSTLRGRVDSQLCRLEGNEVILDVGVTRAEVDSVRFGIEDGFGLKGVGRETKVVFPGLEATPMPVGSLIETALVRELNRRVSLISGRAERAEGDVRESVGRFRIDLSSPSEELRQAVEQAWLGFDLRLAQTMAHQDRPGITADVDMNRAVRTQFGHAGIELFGMRFFRERLDAQGTANVQTPKGYLSIAFDSIRRQSGLLFSDRGYGRTILSGFEGTSTRDGTRTRPQTNLVYSWLEGDTHMERDKLADHLEGLFAALWTPEQFATTAGPVLAKLGLVGRETQRLCREYATAPGRLPDSRREAECAPRVLGNSILSGWAGSARREAEALLAARGLSPDQRAQFQGIVDFDAASQRSFEATGTLTGPPVDIEMTAFLSDASLQALAGRDPARVRAVVAHMIALSRQDRSRERGLDEARASVSEDAAALDELAARFDRDSRQFRSYTGIATAHPTSLLVDFQVDDRNVPRLDRIAAQPTTTRLRDRAGAMIDGLFESIQHVGDLDGGAERIVGQSLVGLTEDLGQLDLRVNVQMDLDDNWAESFPQYREAFAAFHSPEHDLHLLQSWTRGQDVQLLGDAIGWDVERLTSVSSAGDE